MRGRYIKKYKAVSYWMVKCPCHPSADSKGYVKEHRLIVEVGLGGFLSPEWHVHHKDGDGLNNNTENLELISRSDHVKHHMYWATSPTMGKGRKPYKHFGELCAMYSCDKKAKSNRYCQNHNRDAWRQKRREVGLAYT
tara:strand:- start:272 stop:685 length:414 start_codon:yes stop_codon:yes gene_type:complete